MTANSIAALLPDEHIELALRAADKSAALASLASKAAGLSAQPYAVLLAALTAREALGSTGIGHGIAVPHARIAGFSRLFGLFARLHKPLAFDAIDGQPVDLIVLLLSPAEANAEHLATLAAISRWLRDKTVADRLRTAASVAAVRALLPLGA